MFSVHKMNTWVNSKHFKRINGLITSISCFLSKSTAETLFCFQSKENRLTFPTRERVWVLKCEDINVKYYSDLPCTSPNHQLCDWTINPLNEKQKLHHLLGQQRECWRLGQPCAEALTVLWVMAKSADFYSVLKPHLSIKDFRTERRTKWIHKNYNHALMWIHTHNRQTTRCSCQACQICTF